MINEQENLLPPEQPIINFGNRRFDVIYKLVCGFMIFLIFIFNIVILNDMNRISRDMGSEINNINGNMNSFSSDFNNIKDKMEYFESSFNQIQTNFNTFQSQFNNFQTQFDNIQTQFNQMTEDMIDVVQKFNYGYDQAGNYIDQIQDLSKIYKNKTIEYMGKAEDVINSLCKTYNVC